MRGLEQIPWLYDGLMAVSERFGFSRWRRRLLAETEGLVLEVGCGTGRNLPDYPSEVEGVMGIDPCFASLLAARRRAPRAPLVLASAEALPFRDDRFETVVSSLVFCSVPDAPRGLAEIARVLRPMGHLRMLEHVRHHRPLLARLQDFVQPLWTPLTGGCYPNRDTETTVTAAGFRIHDDLRREGTLRLFTATYEAADATD